MPTFTGFLKKFIVYFEIMNLLDVQFLKLKGFQFFFINSCKY